MVLSRALAFHEVGQALLTACSAALASPTATGVDGAPDRAVLTSGDLADDACDCGTLTVSVGRSYRSSSPPAEASGFVAGSSGFAGPCVPPYVVAELAVRIVRCAPTSDTKGNPPTEAVLLASARQVESDAYEVECATMSQLQEMGDDDDIDGFLVSTQPRVGPSGACAGSQLNLAVWVAR